jgi:hypothetical protein
MEPSIRIAVGLGVIHQGLQSRNKGRMSMGFFDESHFNANDIDPATEYRPLPEGEYRCAILSAEEKPTKAGTGSYVNLKLQVLDGEFKGRVLFDMITLKNPNVTAQDMGRATLSSLCRSVCVPSPRSWSAICNIPFRCKIGHDKFNDQIRNKVKAYIFKDDQKQEPAASSTDSAEESAPWG